MNKLIEDVLKTFGVTEKEAEIYIFLTKHGALKCGEIARHLKKDKAQVFRIVKSLQAKGLVESTFEVPMRFTPVQFETILDLKIKTKREEAASLESTREELLSYWKNLSKTRLEPSERFLVIEGCHKIYFKIFQMMKETKNQLSAIFTFPNLMRAYQFGVFDSVANHSFRGVVQFRFLTEFSGQNLNAIKDFLRKMPKTGFNIKERDPDLGIRTIPQMVVTDEELLIFIASAGDFLKGQDNVCLWTNCKTLVQSFSAVFEDLWRNSKNVKEKIIEVKTGKLASRTCVFNNAETAYKKFCEIVHSAKEDI
ncbi:MAG: helix-turn-helix domain-containing protein, partial [Candidatus Bathyarchaeia archaeon]